MSNPLVEEIVARALPLIHVEREAERLDTQEAYEAFRARHAELSRQVINQLRACGWMRDDATAEDMREIYYAVLRHPELEGSASDRAVAGSLLNEAWKGVHDWVG
ncbi:hypothetical protein [Acetobacter fabarum]|uniref:hypothetical protein n=1 Tax=Acetobacter fabarum TaxID=483199 RepID=UPI0039E96D6E